MELFSERLNKALQKLDEKNQLRSLRIVHDKIDFTSNDYLGLARSKELFVKIQNQIEKVALPFNGGTGSRLLSGNNELAERLEDKLASVFQSEKALLFNSGYAANMAVLASLPQRGDTILYDELVHACMHDGMRLSKAQRFNFLHNDLDDLERKIKSATGQIFIAVESVYSMDGDENPMEELVQLAGKYKAVIILDEAHSTGSYGPEGAGIAVYKKLHQKIPVRIYTFGKAMGVHGACVAGDKVLIDYLINFSRPFIFSTAMAPHSLISIGCAFDFLKENIHLQTELRNKIGLFLLNRNSKSKSAIQAVVVPGNSEAKRLAQKLQHHGFDCRAILSPSVPVGKERIRICLHTFNSDEEILKLAKTLSEERV
jgi:8-amino-7-oxononanoate synthase